VSTSAPLPDASVPTLTFLHVSDIHFSVHDGPRDADLEGAIRDRLLEDIERLRPVTGDADLVLAVGDLAFSGQPEEYETAAEWLKQAAVAAGTHEDHVLCVPGNHDVDRSAQGPLHASLRWHLRHCEPAAISNHLRKILLDSTDSAVLLAPLANYNQFAARFDCDIRPERGVVLPARDIALGNRRVRIHGITSPWISDQTDAATTPSCQLALGLFQLATVGSDPTVFTITLCHHPLNWIRERADARGFLRRAHLRLYGHEHARGIEVGDDARSLSLHSGAVTPPRDEDDWYPSYNVIRLRLKSANCVELAIWLRRWSQEHAAFDRDTAFAEPHVLELPLPSLPSEPPPATPAAEPLTPGPEPALTPRRRLLYEILAAPPDRLRAAASALGIEPEESVAPQEMDRAIVGRAQDLDRLEELHKKVTCG